MTWRGGSIHDLTGALRNLRAAVAESAYPLRLPSAESARADAAALVAQIDDYLLPRLDQLDAPLLAVVGGATGGGKSTLVNSLARAPASPAGVVRPTTRSPVLICNPVDARWFRGGTRLAGFTRPAGRRITDPYRLEVVVAPALPPGLALLDTPDLDSVVEAHRDVASQLLAAADLWLFVTTASRYADAVPWQYLQEARDRGAVVAVILNRVPDHASQEVAGHLTDMLSQRGFAGSPLFVLPETWADRQGMLPEQATGALREWLQALAGDESARSTVIRLTLDGALAALATRAERLAAAAEEQFGATELLAEQVGLAYGSARSTVEHGIRSGTMLRGEVLARWEELWRSGEWSRIVAAAATTWPGAAGDLRQPSARDRDRAAGVGRPAVGQELRAALAASLVSLVRSAAVDAADAVAAAWRDQPDLAGPVPDVAEAVAQLAYDWQRDLLDQVRSQLARADAPASTYAVNATALLAMLGTFAAATAAGTTAITGHEEFGSVLADRAVRELATRTRADLLERLGDLLDQEAAAYLERLAGVPLDGGPARRLRDAAAELRRTRSAARLADREPAPATEPVSSSYADPATSRPPTAPDAPTSAGDYPDGHVPRPEAPAAAWVGGLAAQSEAGR